MRLNILFILIFKTNKNNQEAFASINLIVLPWILDNDKRFFFSW